MTWAGEFPEDFATVAIYFTSHDADGAPVAPSSGFEAADVKIYKNGSATEKTTQNGLTMTSPFDSITGLHCLVIDTSVDTGDGGFWTAGAHYAVILVPDETVDGIAVTRVVGTFRLAASSTLASEVTAIKAKTDNLPADPADASDVAAAFATVNASLTTIAGYVDTEIAAIKAKTDQLTFSSPNQVDANIQSVNDVAVSGTGALGNEWGP